MPSVAIFIADVPGTPEKNGTRTAMRSNGPHSKFQYLHSHQLQKDGETVERWSNDTKLNCKCLPNHDGRAFDGENSQ
jgi:hypothetical protein